jgi:hypothetical protein
MVLHKGSRWRGGVGAALIAALLAAVLVLDNTLPAEDEAKAAALPADLAKIPSDALLMGSGRLAELWSGDVLKSVREKHKKEIEAVPQEFKKRFGLPLEQVERLTLVMLNPPTGPGEPLFFVHTTEPYDLAKILAAHKILKATKHKSETIYTTGDKDMTVYPLDDQALVFGKFDSIRELIDRPQPRSEGHLAGALRLAAGKHALVGGMNLKVFMDAVGDKLPGEVEPYRPLLQALSGTMVVDLGPESRLETALQFETEKDAKSAVKSAQTGLVLLRAGLETAITEIGKQKEDVGVLRLFKQFQEPLKAARIEQKGERLRASVAVKIDPAAAGLAVVESVQRVRAAASRSQTQNNLKQIALAMHNYADTMGGRLPAQAIYDKNGKPLLSWRVLILPYIEQQNLYNQFRLNEAWDSDHNKKLLAMMPRTYATPQDEKTVKEHITYYQGFVGPGAFFEGKKGLRMPADFTDGTSNTIMIVEASKAVPWTKPEDIPFDADKPLPKLGLPGAPGFSAAICDGSVRLFTPKTTQRTLRLAITRNDGQPLGPDY